jgi:xanthosine utilization system XapX-like protein
MRERLFLSPMAAFILPGLQALGFALVGLLVGAVYALLTKADPKESILVGGTIGLVSGWLAGIAWWRAQLERERKAISSNDNHNDTVTLRVIDDSQTPFVTGRIFHAMPCDMERLVSLAKSLASDPRFTVSRFSGPGQLFTRSEYYRLRDYLVDQGMMTWLNPHETGHNQGVVLTLAGRAVMRKLAEAE